MPMKILVVDDEPDLEVLVRQKFRRQLREGSFELVFARNGEEALEVLNQDPSINIVLSDINMPVMDGLTLLGKLTGLDRILNLFSAKVDGDVTGLFYRITREDGGYDGGLKKLTARVVEDLPLQENAYNHFAFKVYDSRNNPVRTDFDSIQIAQGRHSVAGQMLPEDLSLVKDDLSVGDTKLDRIFAETPFFRQSPRKGWMSAKP
jgi:hypothetical protein